VGYTVAPRVIAPTGGGRVCEPYAPGAPTQLPVNAGPGSGAVAPELEPAGFAPAFGLEGVDQALILAPFAEPNDEVDHAEAGDPDS
jgi:hypothetical protein